MTKPMYCPMSFHAQKLIDENFFWHSSCKMAECTPDCAWAMKAQGRYFCAVPAKVATWVESINSERIPTEIETRPLKDDAE